MKPLEIVLKFISYDGVQSNDPADATKITNRIQETDVSGVVRYQAPIADGVTDQAVVIPDANSEYLLIFCDRQISIKINGSTDSLTLSPRATGVKTFMYYHRGAVTGLTISNASGDSANLDVISVNK